MDMRNCRHCGKVFNYMSSPLCPNCEREEERIFEELREYVNNNPLCSMAEASAATGVSAKKIIRYIREGRLEISKGMQSEVRCEKCGKPIPRGKYCDSCVIKINSEVSDAFSVKKQETRMYTHANNLKYNK